MVQIELMKPDDLAEVAALEAMIFSLPWSEKSLEESLEQEHYLFLVARESGAVLGYVGAYFALDEADITNIAIHPKYRRRGIGQALMEQLIVQAKKRGAAGISLEVRIGNVAARALYERMGFSMSGIRKNFYAKPVEDAVVMWKTFASE